MQDHLIEMSIGETIHVGQFLVTLVDIEGDELCLQIEGGEGGEDGEAFPRNQTDELSDQTTLLEVV